MGYEWIVRRRDGRFASGPKKYERLLRFASVRDWCERFPTERARQIYVGSLLRFCEALKIAPDEFLKLPPEEARDKVWGFVKQFRDKPRTAMVIRNSLVNFYRHHNGVRLEFDSRKGGKHYIRPVKKKAEIEYIPNREDVYRMVDAAKSLRDKAIILTLFQSGIRVNALCNLNYGHIRKQLEEGKIPIRLKITDKIDVKLAGKEIDYYYTFLGAEAVNAIKAYVEGMRKKGYKWTDNSPLFLSRNLNRMVPSSVLEVVKKTAERAGLDPKGIWPHCLRKAFRKVLNASDIDEDTKETLMGHKLPGSRGNYFDLHDIDEIERKYLRCNFSRPGVGMSEEAKKEMLLSLWREQAKLYGIDPLRVRIEKTKELGRKLTPDEEIIAIQSEIRKLITHPVMLKEEPGRDCNNSNNCRRYESKLVKEDELLQYLDEGWDIVKELSNGKIIIRRPL
jgi:site-specific recombinase XerD